MRTIRATASATELNRVNAADVCHNRHYRAGRSKVAGDCPGIYPLRQRPWRKLRGIEVNEDIPESGMTADRNRNCQQQTTQGDFGVCVDIHKHLRVHSAHLKNGSISALYPDL